MIERSIRSPRATKLAMPSRYRARAPKQGFVRIPEQCAGADPAAGRQPAHIIRHPSGSRETFSNTRTCALWAAMNRSRPAKRQGGGRRRARIDQAAQQPHGTRSWPRPVRQSAPGSDRGRPAAPGEQPGDHKHEIVVVDVEERLQLVDSDAAFREGSGCMPAAAAELHRWALHDRPTQSP